MRLPQLAWKTYLKVNSSNVSKILRLSIVQVFSLALCKNIQFENCGNSLKLRLAAKDKIAIANLE